MRYDNAMYDARNSSVGHQQHSPRDPSLASRATFRPSPPASLTLTPALTSDTGTYHCRADFADSPSRTTVIKITLH
ncbi:hypothetical protein HAZT_HAZT001336 [Hyalella azteca]|uniref:Ig-like domain-containing protein n=1 Tax=Hyalella azteca TaxID=294128 RepID=A0A6A0H6V9_HYAAZ|nr:hypothetical protein HAZT_HAZT001336 [Hyalella azteca]